MKRRGKNAKKTSVMSVDAIKAMKPKLKAQTITISDMRAKLDEETDNPVTGDVGHSFGFRKEKKKSKKSNTKHDSDEE